GYRGKRWTDSINPDIETVIDWEGPGNCLYSAGDSVYKSGYSGWAEPDYTVLWTDADLPVRAGAVIEETRLYVYYTFDYKDTISNDNYALTFNGDDLTGTEDAAYSDRKGFGSYNYESGVLIYDVTGIFDSSGNSAIFTNNEDLTQNKQISFHGFMLVTIYSYEGAQDIHVILNEGYDQLYVNQEYHVSSDETYAYAPFDSLNYEDDVSATLVTFVPAGIAPEGALWINGEKVADDAWSAPPGALHQIGINSFDATEQIRNGDNIVAFQQTGNKETMFAANAILILGSPDLQVLSVGINLPKGKEVFHNGTNTYTAVISNNGTIASGTSVASLSIDGVEVAAVDVPALNPGATVTVELADPANRITGTLLTIDVTADSGE
ncbi:MAG: DUF3344 domain-containing protein, partial [Methanogenium sp.]|nr:DUF3344 domain-containing protein [Methanogenium sp.]